MVPLRNSALAVAADRLDLNSEQVALLKRTVAKGTDDNEFALFMTVSQRLGLDPFLKQIHAVKRWDNDLEREVMSIQVGIDGYRLGAERTGESDGQEGPHWCGEDGKWVDVWLSTSVPPVAARVMVFRKGRSRPYVGVAHWASYCQFRKDGNPNAMWRKHGPGQLAKCAEALAIRKAFPAETAGTHTEDEMGTNAIDASFTESKPVFAAPPMARAPADTPELRAQIRAIEQQPAAEIRPIGPPPGVPSTEAAPKRGPGRPPKEKPADPTPTAAASSPTSSSPSTSSESTTSPNPSPTSSPVAEKKPDAPTEGSEGKPVLDRWGQVVGHETTPTGDQATDADDSFGEDPVDAGPPKKTIEDFFAWLKGCKSQKEIAKDLAAWKAWSHEQAAAGDATFAKGGANAVAMTEAYARRKAEAPA